MKKALVLGANGQCGSYLIDILLEKGYVVYGMIRKDILSDPSSNLFHVTSNSEIYKKTFFLCNGDLADPDSIKRVLIETRPDEIYNEAGVDHVSGGADFSNYAADITGAAVGRLLEMILQINPKIRFFQPCTSHMFGKPKGDIQNESTPFDPLSLYACYKHYAYNLCRYYRRRHGIFASTAILYNHESPRRLPKYVSRKISQSVALIAAGKLDRLGLGNLKTLVDWGYAKEFMEAAWNILQLDAPDDFVLATGEAHPVREFVDEAFRIVGLKPEDYIYTDPKFFRPVSNDLLRGDISKAKKAFGFNPRIKFKKLVKLMVEHDLKLIRKNQL